MDEAIEVPRPIPRPRRTVPNLTITKYENVTIDSLNKKIVIDDQNLHSESQSKIPNNKTFRASFDDKDKDRCILTETNNLSSNDKDQNVLNEERRPTPAPRRPPPIDSSPDQIYENAPSTSSSPKSLTGAISKTQNVVARKAPEVPKALNTEPDRLERSPQQDYPGEFNESKAKLKKSVSNSTLDSSISSTSSTSESQKYKNPSPSHILKSLGSTSRLLTEAITERVTHKAKNILDKNFKSSHEKLSNWGSNTTSRLKNVRKRINNLNINNLSLARNERRDAEYDLDRPQTLPPNDEVFQSISFNSPLNKAGNVTNLADTESSYEIPKSLKASNNYSMNLNSPPSYDDSIKGTKYTTKDPDASLQDSFHRNSNVTQSLNIHRPVATKQSRPLPSPNNLNRSVPDIPILVIKEETNSSTESLPMPSYPPPVLKSEGVYGKINAVAPPVRTKRKKNYETIEIRKLDVDPPSNRATIDSIEIRENIQDSSRDASLELNELIKVSEKFISHPDRSDSWSYHDNNDDECSSPEPIYANQESTYSRLCEMETEEVPVVLTPRLETQRKAVTEDVLMPLPSSPFCPSPKEILYEFDPLLRNRGNTIGKGMNKSNQLLLLENLLEEDVYGSVVGDSVTTDDQSVDSSDDDNGNASSVPPPPPPERMDSLAEALPVGRTNSPKNENSMQIIHQNASLRSDSLENIIEEQDIDAYLARTDNNPIVNEEVDLVRPSQPRSQWFVDDAAAVAAVQHRINPFNKTPGSTEKVAEKIPPGVPPPSYSEAIATTPAKSSNKSADTKYPPMPASSEPSSKTSMKSMFSNVFNKMESLKRKTSFRGTRPSDVHVILEMVPKPTLSQRMVLHEGHLIRLPCGGVEDILKEMQNRVAFLRDRKFITFADKEMKNQKESFALEHITTIQCVNNHKFSNNSMQMYCFEVTTAAPKNHNSQQQLSNPNMIITNTNSGNKKSVRSCHLYGVVKESERDIWMQKLLESLTNVFPRSLTCTYYRAGWCYLKSSITTQWSGAWILLQKRKRRLVYFCEATMNMEKLDLRKARWINLKESDDSSKNLHVEGGQMLMVDCPPYTIYMIMSSSRETKIWRHIIREVAHNNGPTLHEQQLTKYNVPVLVDKCINFVYIHGSMTEGIYRKSGSTAAIQKLVGLFRTDAFSVEMTRSEYSEHDVANVLKRFMRSLPQTLLSRYAPSFISITKLNSKVERISAYKELLNRLSEIEYQTLKKLIGHLAFIQSQKSKNKMGVDNLALVWGPTLFQNSTDDMSYSQSEADVVSDLITLYKNLYQLTPDEVIKEQEMLACLQKYYAAAENLADSFKQSGDLKVWITINSNPENSKEEKTQINVTLTPTKTAYEVCKELAIKMKLSAHKVTLNEVILNDSLERPLHHSERVFDVVLRWSYWPEADRKNNYLVVKPIKTIHEINRALKHLPTTALSNELKFADCKTKSLKPYQLELNDGKITVLKKEKGLPTVFKEVPLNDVTAYLGCEKKRDCQSRWAITLIERSNNKVLRSRDLPFIGHVIAGTECHDQIIWLSAIWDSLYRDDIMPPGEIIIP